MSYASVVEMRRAVFDMYPREVQQPMRVMRDVFARPNAPVFGVRVGSLMHTLVRQVYCQHGVLARNNYVEERSTGAYEHVPPEHMAAALRLWDRLLGFDDALGVFARFMHMNTRFDDPEY